MTSRRRFLSTLASASGLGIATGLSGLGALAGCSGPATDTETTEPGTGTESDDGTTDETATTRERPTAVGTELVADGFVAPVVLDQPAGDDRLFVADQPGTIYAVSPDGETATYLDLRDQIVDVGGYDERGLLGLAFHPNFQENGRFFTLYSAPVREGTPDSYNHTGVLAEFTADPAANAASRDSESTLLEIPEPQSNHNGGALVFGPDAHLYVGLGDGGAANDQGQGHVEDWYVPNPGGNGQDVTENLLGSILRLDVDDQSGDRPYGIPDDNPFVGDEGLDEHYAWGLRNPWRMSFDRDRLLAADVGQAKWEEVNVVEKGGNYGWNVREGAHCFQTDDCPTQTPDGAPLIDPVLEYAHGGDPVSGVAIVGGYVARDGALPGFDGIYVFADWRSEGRLFAADTIQDPPWEPWVVDIQGEIGPFVLAFGRDTEGALYACTSESSGISGESGAVYRLTGA